MNPKLYEWLAIVNDKSSLNKNVAQEGAFVKKNDDILEMMAIEFTEEMM